MLLENETYDEQNLPPVHCLLENQAHSRMLLRWMIHHGAKKSDLSNPGFGVLSP